MRKFQIRCSNARKVGAIGIFYGVYERYEAETEWAAEIAFRQDYETMSPIEIVEEVLTAGG